ncbi:DUF6192 family protein [Streptomyces sp. SLBN-8D4]|uniref:DUF6192 family protein n=1 Tax=Streptomyces sp. SLBN-8D4 TaxID=3377728 RepID=UPI003C7B23F3
MADDQVRFETIDAPPLDEHARVRRWTTGLAKKHVGQLPDRPETPPQKVAAIHRLPTTTRSRPRWPRPGASPPRTAPRPPCPSDQGRTVARRCPAGGAARWVYPGRTRCTGRAIAFQGGSTRRNRRGRGGVVTDLVDEVAFPLPECGQGLVCRPGRQRGRGAGLGCRGWRALGGLRIPSNTGVGDAHAAPLSIQRLVDAYDSVAAGAGWPDGPGLVQQVDQLEDRAVGCEVTVAGQQSWVGFQSPDEFPLLGGMRCRSTDRVGDRLPFGLRVQPTAPAAPSGAN